MFLTVVFCFVVLLTRKYIAAKKSGPYHYAAQNVDNVPAFIRIPPITPYPWELAYVPSKSTVVQNIVENVKQSLHVDMKVLGFSLETDFEDYVRQINNSKKVLAAIVFDHNFQNSNDPLPLQVKYHLRFSSIKKNRRFMYEFQEDSWLTDSLFPSFPSLGPRNPHDTLGGNPGYISEGFLAVQHAVDKAIMKYHNRTAAEALFNDVRIFVRRFPYPSYYYDAFFLFASIFIPFIVVCIFSINHLTLLQSLVWEKANRLKEYQLMIGLSNWMLWAAYFFTFLVSYLIIVIFICIIFYVETESVPVFQYSSPIIVFIFLLIYSVASVCFSFMISTFFSNAPCLWPGKAVKDGPKPRDPVSMQETWRKFLPPRFVSAMYLLQYFAKAIFVGLSSPSLTYFTATLGGFCFFLSYLPAADLLADYGRLTFLQKLLGCLSSNYALALGFKFIVESEMTKTGIKWNNLFSQNGYDNFLFAYVLLMLLIDAFLYVLVAWYIDAVCPGKYGIPKPWNFFLKYSYWSGKPAVETSGLQQFHEPVQSKYFEAEPTGLVTGITIKHLHKVFYHKGTMKVAIKELSLNLYEGQITVLLGHNGAGKSTTLSILSGLYPPTSGQAYIYGYDISTQMTEIRKSLGICPQQNLLFDYLTVSEHLQFYCAIKGVSQEQCLEETEHMLSAFNLLEKRDMFSKSLSGGMQRKLSIIIALIGDSKVVILDEPTSGMDPASRQATWDLLQNYKENRTMLLTTHYMDEADVLGDRIAIMVQGYLRCYGSSIFLKKLYGVGYHIVMVKAPHCDVEEVTKLIHNYVPVATMKSNVGTELSFILPQEYIYRFEALFTNLERKQAELGIASFGVSITTMEEVFLRVSQMENVPADTQAVQPSSQEVQPTTNWNRNASEVREVHSSMPQEISVTFNTGCQLYCQQFRAMFLKRMMFSRRNWKLVLLQTLGLVASFAFMFEIGKPSSADENAREMNLGDYGRTTVPFSISGNSNFTTDFLKLLDSKLTSENQELKEVKGNLLNYLMENKDKRVCIIAFSIDIKESQTIFTALFNNEAYHSPSLALAVLDNVLFMSLFGKNASLTISNKPQPRRSIINKEKRRLENGNVVASNMQLGIAIMISGFCLLTVTERISKAKQIQFLSGTSVLVYWISALLYDFIIFLISILLLLIAFRYYRLNIYITEYHILETMLIFILFGWSAIPSIYVLSFLFTGAASAYIKLILLNYFSGTLCVLIDSTVDYMGRLSNNTKKLLRESFHLFPSYNLAKCIGEYTRIYRLKILCLSQKTPSTILDCSKENTEKNIYSLEKGMLGKYFIIMGITGLILLLLLLLCETTCWRVRAFLNQQVFFRIYKILKKNIVTNELSGKSEDEDVQNERTAILEHPERFLNSMVLIKELTKIYFSYTSVLAVRNISVAIQKRECFGLLGFNGAGKTTTFEILTGEESATSGDVLIDGVSINKNILKVRSRIGYCPQFDALLEYMTAEEILIMYARVWGVSESHIHLYVNQYLNSMELEPLANKIISTFSGGNKRRLSTAIAIMGRSSVVFLDEPSAGMDPVARRLLWNAVTKTRDHGKAIVITSHSMEECDALCTRLGIMVKGRFMCLGSPQHLKNKFGNVYIVKIKINSDDALENVKNFIKTTFPGSILKHHNQKILNYYIPSKDRSWGKMFGILENAKKELDLEDYSISQITLEQVFLTFANPEDVDAYAPKKKP
ncbi:phospholipid-transporting ATPase ABCA3-like [Ochotona princeps]|uniref:phospholipid-transporting ATPase ABCA3-like n=1 Tax=Ochotona princeps TaxID=9978 RepID=UPI0027148CB4|nr:phospholipid-transporting ATPase ABCA3-like [Ochotona princeps]